MYFEWAVAFVQSCFHFSGWNAPCRGMNKCKRGFSHPATHGTRLEGSWDPPGARAVVLPVLQVFVHLPSTEELPPRTLLASHIPSHEESLCKSVKGSGDIPISAEILHAEKNHKITCNTYFHS